MLNRAATPKTTKASGCKLWHMILAMFVMGLTMRVALGNIEIPEPEPTPFLYAYGASHSPYNYYRFRQHQYERFNPPVVDVMPVDLNGKMEGPLLTSILQRYAPHASPIHADELRDTLPPSADPRMIVIIPGDEVDSGPMY